MLAAMFASLPAMPLNVLLSIMGIRMAQWTAVVGGVLVIRPILLKMLIGHQFEEFRIEPRRETRRVVPVNMPEPEEAG